MSNARNLARVIVDSSGDIAAANLDNAVPADGSISTAKLADNAVTSAKIANSTIVNDDLATAVKPVGVAQTWQNVAPSRSINVTYTNTSGRPIQVWAWGDGNVFGDVNIQIFVDGLLINASMASEGSSGGGLGNVSAIVPNGSTYLVNFNGGSPSLYGWTELR